jgi:hypothetical protein
VPAVRVDVAAAIETHDGRVIVLDAGQLTIDDALGEQ